MNKFDLEIRPSNAQLHSDIERTLNGSVNKWLHFELRYSGGNIVDLVVREFKSFEHNSYDNITGIDE